jgi:diguanylate cyclase (GGDEF)-like protein
MLVVMLVATELGGFLFTSHHQSALIDLRDDTREMRILQQALVDEKENAEDFILTGDRRSFLAFHAAGSVLEASRTTVLPRLDRAGTGTERTPSENLAELTGIWARAVSLAERGAADEAQAFLRQRDARSLMSELRSAMRRYLELRNATGVTFERSIEVGATLVVLLQVIGGMVTVAFLAFAFRANAKEADGRRAAVEEAISARRQVEILFEMADTLQSASGYEDAHAVLQATSRRLLPHLSGKLYVFNNSRDRLDPLAEWGERDGELSAAIAPTECWALKRGKPHLNNPFEGTLPCSHFTGQLVTLEVPMLARGEVYGLLSFSSGQDDARQQLKDCGPVISALADAMSLALSNLSLREKLRNQALRDPLTGLYNRRYMEDMLDRFVRLAARNETSVSVVMIDLDHFKRLNDQHGHLLGDAVLRAVAGTLSQALRETDIACRYGGEELIVLLPDCEMNAAMRKAEDIRARIEALSSAHGVEISASLGVAAFPLVASSVNDLVQAADDALYEAKGAGRNRVASAKAGSNRQPSLMAAE